DLGLRVKVNSALTRWNENEIEEMYAITDSLGVHLQFDMQVTPRDDGDTSPMSIAASADGIRRLMRVNLMRAGTDTSEEALPAPPTSKHCGAGSSGIAIDPFGNIYPCVQWRKAVGNLHN